MKIDKWKKAYGVAIVSDLLDVIPTPFSGFLMSFPLIGDPFDLITSFILWKILKEDYNLINLAEVIPGADPLPLHSLSVFIAQRKLLNKVFKQ